MAISSTYSVSDLFFSTSGQNPFGNGAGAQSAIAPLTIGWNNSQTVGLDDGLEQIPIILVHSLQL